MILFINYFINIYLMVISNTFQRNGARSLGDIWATGPLVLTPLSTGTLIYGRVVALETRICPGT